MDICSSVDAMVRSSVAALVDLGLVAQSVALGLERLGLFLDIRLVGHVLVPDLAVVGRMGAALFGGQGIEVLLQALGLIEVPLIRSAVLLEHGVIFGDDGLVALRRLETGNDRRRHSQHRDGHGHLRDQRVFLLHPFFGGFRLFVGFHLLQWRIGHGSGSPVQRGLGRGEARDRDPVGGATNVVEAHSLAEGDG